jgi:hypothetical protein
MHRTLAKPAVLTIAVLVIVTACGFFLRSSTGSATTPPPADAEESSSKAPATRVAAEIPQKNEATKTESPKAAEPAMAHVSSKAAAGPRIEGEHAADHRRLLETVGTLTAAHCYQSYLNLSFLRDGKAKGTYTRNEASGLLDSVVSVLDSVDRKLAGLGKISLDREDRESLEQIRDVSDLLRRQAKELQTFWDSDKESDAAKYEEARKDSWATLSKLMGGGR